MRITFKQWVCLAALWSWSGPGAARAGDEAALVLTFDELPSTTMSDGWAEIPDGYGGLQWNNFGVLNGLNRRAEEVYHLGVVSPENVAFPLSGAPASISRAAGFDLRSAYVTAPFDMHVRVQGMVGTNVTYDHTFTVSNTAPALLDFNYAGVDRVIFVSSPNSQFALDNLVVVVPPPEASCTFVISPRSRVHGIGAGQGTVAVTTQAGCDWNVSNTNSWVTILSHPDNAGSGTVRYSVAAAATARSGFIVIAGQRFDVSQSAVPVGDEQVLTFDELLPSSDGIEPGYGGLQWYNFGTIDGTILPMDLGYHTGVVSPDNVAFNRYGERAFISTDHLFDLKSAYVTPLRSGVLLRVQGSAGGIVTHDNTYAVSNTAPTWIEFNYEGVDRVDFTPSRSSTWFVLDNMVISPGVMVPVDSDGDGVPDSEDACPGTAAGVVVDEHGCSIEQLVPCDGPVRGGHWNNHGQYVATVTKVALSFRRAKLITAREMVEIVRAAAKSRCGKRW